MKKPFSILILVCLILWVPALHAQLLSSAELDSARVYTNLSDALQNPEAVYRLDLSKQKLKEFPTEIFQLKNLNELRLNKNKISQIPGEIYTLRYLQILECRHNEIESMPTALFKLRELRELDLSDNLIDKIPDQISDLVLLEVLALYDNPIEYYPDSLEELKQLKVFDLLHNEISTETQERLRSLLPSVKVIMSPPCPCQDGGE